MLTGNRLLKNWSISRRLSLWYSLTILFLLGAFALITYSQFHQSILNDFDLHLKHETSLLVPLIAAAGAEPVFIEPDVLNSTAYRTTGIYATFVRLLTVTGGVIAESPNFTGISELPVNLPPSSGETAESRIWNGEPLRSLYSPLLNADIQVVGWLEVSGIEWVVQTQLGFLIRTYMAGILISTLLAFGGGYLLARRALRPVEEITLAAKNIRATDLGARLPTREGVNDEISRLAGTINDLLTRLENSIKREQRFISNATHELLTPLTTLRGELDLARRQVGESDTLASLDIALSDIDRMESIIRALLALSRAEKLTSAPRTRVDVGDLCREHVNRFKDRADLHGIKMDVGSQTGHFIEADPVHIGTVLDNLLDNALKYTPDGGSVTVRTELNGGAVRITVDDSGYGYSAETGEKIFDRFFRADEAEIQKKSGSGLGLAIARAIVQAYDGEISSRSPGLGSGATFVVEFPRAET